MRHGGPPGAGAFVPRGTAREARLRAPRGGASLPRMTGPSPDSTPPWRDTPPALWRTGAGFLLFIVFYAVLLSLWFIALTPIISAMMAGRQVATLVMLSSFAVALLALELVLRLLHGRGLGVLIGSLPLTLRQGGRVLLYALPVVLVISLLPMSEALEPRRYLSTGTWLRWLPLGLLAVAIQISAEEFLFRGYLQGRLQARLDHPALWLGLPALIFGALHFDATAGDNAIWFVVSAAAFGLAAGDLTARAGTLGPALALHFLNNCIALLGVSFGDELGGLALYHLTIRQDDPALLPLIPVELASTFVLWLTARLALRR